MGIAGLDPRAKAQPTGKIAAAAILAVILLCGLERLHEPHKHMVEAYVMQQAARERRCACVPWHLLQHWHPFKQVPPGGGRGWRCCAGDLIQSIADRVGCGAGGTREGAQLRQQRVTE